MLQEVEVSSSTAASSTITSPTSSVTQSMWYVAGCEGTGSTASGHSMAVQEEVQLLERHVEFMRLFFQHIARCPPHGPFRYYSAMTFVEQTRVRYATALSEAATSTNNTNTTDSSSNSAESRAMAEEVAMVYGDDAEAVLRAVTVVNVLALMERYFNTRHLCNWPLLYVPAEIHLSDIDQLAAQQAQLRQAKQAK